MGLEMSTWWSLWCKPPLFGQLHSCITLQCQNFCFHPHCSVAAQPFQDFGTCLYGVRCWQCFYLLFIVDHIILPSLRSLLLLELQFLNAKVLLYCYCHLIVQLSHNLLFQTWSYLHPFRTLPTLLLLSRGTEIEVGKPFFEVLRLVNSFWALLNLFS